MSKKIKMLLDNGFDPDLRVYKEALYLKECGNDIEIICLDRKNKYKETPTEIIDGIKITRIFPRTDKTTQLIENNKIVNKLKYFIYLFWLIKFAKQVKEYLKKEQFEILHCHDLPMAYLGVKLFKKKNIVFDMHEYYSNKKNKILNFFISKIVKYTQKKSKWIIHVNEFQIKDIKEKNKSKLVFLPNYPEKKKFEGFKHQPSDDLRISYTGILRHYVPLSNLMKAAEELEGISVSINGAGSEYEKLLQESENMKNSKVTGPYTHTDIARFYENTDLVYIVYNKGNKNDETAFPTKFYEALIAKIPIIASEGTYISKFVLEKDIGFIVDGTNYLNIKAELKKILDNRNILNKKIENIGNISNEYIWENVVLNLDQIYGDC